jgi:HlyD family secretion protein
MTPEAENSNESLEKYTPAGSLVKVEQEEIPAEETGLEVTPQSLDRSLPSKRAPARRKWGIRLGVLLLLVLIVAFFVWRSRRPTVVAVVKPVPTAITETIASSGRVGGVTETLVGAQAAGTVEQLFVKEGDRVVAGQQLAILKNDVAEAQVAQSEQAINTARAQLEQTSRGPLSSELDAASEQVGQAQAQVTQQQAALAQTQKSVAQARAQLNQLKAERELAAKQLARTKSLVESKVIARAELDQAQTNFRVAEERVEAQQQAVELAQANVRSAEAGIKAARANLGAQQARLRTVQSGARPEDVRVAQQRLREAEEALRVARQQAGNAIVTAPFAGIVTAINAELGQTVGAQGVLKLVSGELEIRLDVDESNLADLSVGQTTIVSSSTFTDSTFQGRVSEIGAAVDVARGTVQVTLIPVNPPEWLRPGQTVNVNIVTAKSIERLIIPPTAITRAGDRNVVYVIENGRAVEKIVVTRPPTPEGVPVLAGLTVEDRIIADVSNIKAGDAVRVRRQEREEK